MKSGMNRAGRGPPGFRAQSIWRQGKYPSRIVLRNFSERLSGDPELLQCHLGRIPPRAEKPGCAAPVDPSAIQPYWRVVHRAYRNIEGAPALGAQPRTLRWWIAQQPQRCAFGKCRSMFFVQPAFCVLKRSAVEHTPVMFGPLGHAFAIASATAWSAVLRAEWPARWITAHAATPATGLVACELLNVCHLRASGS